MTETLRRWEAWAAECFSKNKDQLRPKIEHIHDLEWGNEELRVEEDIQTIRQQAALTKIIREEPGTETWIDQKYAGQDIGQD